MRALKGEDGDYAVAVWLWIAAIAFYGFGDLVTTVVGLTFERVVEAGPIAGAVYGRYGPVSMVVLKVLSLGVGYLFWRVLPEPQNVGVPLGLATVGVAATIWNVLVIAGLV